MKTIIRHNTGRSILLSLLLVALFGNTSAAQTTFSEEFVVTNQNTINPRSVYSVDIDGDSDNDIVAASFESGMIVWLRNINGTGTFEFQQTVTSEVDSVEEIVCNDIDGDGDPDIVSASRAGNMIAWYENEDGLGTFGPQQVISTTAEGACFVFCADLDGDGDSDVLSASDIDNEAVWYENTDGEGTFGPEQIIDNQADSLKCVFSVDIDGDEDFDVVTTSYNNDTIAWYENTNGQGDFGAQQIVSTEANGAHSVYCVDIDNDGDNDIVASLQLDNAIVWFENMNGLGNFSFGGIVTLIVAGARSVHCADIDLDGYVDVVATSVIDDKVSWYENINGTGNFGYQHLLTAVAGEVMAVTCADLDNDGDIDVISGIQNYGDLVWFENLNAQGEYSYPYRIIPVVNDPVSVCCSDMDGDGDNDIVVGSMFFPRISWLDNTNGYGDFSLQRTVSDQGEGIISIFASDIDGDGDNDILSASRSENKIAWYENFDGLGSFSTQREITRFAMGAISVYSTDLDGDGDEDVISAAENSSSICWYENMDGLGNFSASNYIHTNFGVHSVLCSDLDGDGDSDVISAGALWEEGMVDLFSAIRWSENMDGTGTFDQASTIIGGVETDRHYSAICCGDVDGDSDNDIIYSCEDYIEWGIDNNFGWLENDGEGNFTTDHPIDAFTGTISLYCIDLDNDGDNDIITSSTSWYENLDGAGNFSPARYLSGASASVASADLDGDGDNDVVNASFASNSVNWSRNELTDHGMIINATPLDDEIVIDAEGGNFDWDLSIENVSGDMVVFDIWTGLVLPNTAPYGPLSMFNGLTLPAGIDIFTTPNQMVPQGAPEGVYTYIACVGDYWAGETYANDIFQFTKLPVPGAATVTGMTGGDGWILTNFFEMDELSSEESSSALPLDYIVENPYPNPFNPTATINIGLPESAFLRINVYNVLGQQVAVLANNPLNAGYHNFILDGSNLTSGVYFIHANVHGKMDEMRKVVLMK